MTDYTTSIPVSNGFTKTYDAELVTLRDQFAMAALPALIAKRDITKPWSEVPFNAYSIADMMLEARREKK